MEDTLQFTPLIGRNQARAGRLLAALTPQWGGDKNRRGCLTVIHVFISALNSFPAVFLSFRKLPALAVLFGAHGDRRPPSVTEVSDS